MVLMDEEDEFAFEDESDDEEVDDFDEVFDA